MLRRKKKSGYGRIFRKELGYHASCLLPMKTLRFAVIGTGFWSYFQLRGWGELSGVQPVAFCDPNRRCAEALGKQFQVENIYDNIDDLLDQHAFELDFIDIITDANSHFVVTEKAAARGLNVICQKPMAPDLDTCRRMVELCQRASVTFLIHENFRWQRPIRKFKEKLLSGVVGKPFRASVVFCSAFPVFENQPFLAELEQFIITDIGAHILDVCRFLFGEVLSLYCQTSSINPGIKGEDVANVFMKMRNDMSCYVEMSYASILEREAFPQTLVRVEGEKGSLVLTHDFFLRTTTVNGTAVEKWEPEPYPWASPSYAVVHSSIVDCNQNLLAGLHGSGQSETTGEDNFETMRLVYASYDSARENRLVHF
jgi:D-apiose dehydrogenase